MVRTRNDGLGEEETDPSSNEEGEETLSSKRRKVSRNRKDDEPGTSYEPEPNEELERTRGALEPEAFKQFAHLFQGVLNQANKNAHKLAESQMERIQAENARAADRQRAHEDSMATRQREDAERFAERQRILNEANAERQRTHELEMARITGEQSEKAEERQKAIFEQLLDKNSKSFKTALEKEGEKEEKREKDKTSSQGALFHPLSATVGDAPLSDLPKDPGNMSIQTIVLKYYNIPVQIE
jgi:hypothetical protein